MMYRRSQGTKALLKERKRQNPNSVLKSKEQQKNTMLLRLADRIIKQHKMQTNRHHGEFETE